MSQSYLSQFPMERVTALNTIPLFRVFICVVQILLLHGVVDLVGRLYRFLSRSESQIEDVDDLIKVCGEEEEEQQGFKSIQDNDMELAMAKLGIYLDPKAEKIGFGDDFANIFEEKEPSLEEVKEAFDVFDENKDGFIDEVELQRVLCNLGLKEGLKLQNCKRMISRYDENEDGRIEFREFVKLMENTFC